MVRIAPAAKARTNATVSGEVERDRADQDACAEPHDQPDRGQLDAKEQRYDGADDE